MTHNTPFDASRIEITERHNGEMLMKDVFVDGRKAGHFYVIPGIAVWARKEREGRKPMSKRFSHKGRAIAWIVRQ